MLTARRITKRYGVVTALADVQFSVPPGEIIALAGENGSGKSTLARILCGLTMPDEGEILLGGEHTAFGSPRDALDAGIALVAQELTTIPHLTVAENVTLPFLRGGTGRWIQRRHMAALASQALGRLGVDLDPGAPAGRLTTVEQTFVEIAKAIVTEPQYLILDEATSRLGPQDVDSVLKVVRQLASEGVSSVLITHRLAEMTAACERVTVLRDGRNAGELARESLSEDSLVRLMVGRELKGHPRRQAGLGDVALSVRGITVQGSRSPVTLTVRSGEVVGLAGLVGAGRTELLEALGGLRARSGGQVDVHGEAVPEGIPSQARAHGLSLVPEDRHRQGLVLPFSVTENFVLGRHRGATIVRRSQDRRAAQAAVATFGIKVADVDAPISALSGGNQQKVVIARALASQPRALLLDEPTRGVDVGAREEIYKVILSEAERGLAVLLASSDLVELLSVCDRILVMHEGALVGELNGRTATEEEIALLSAGGGRRVDVA